MLVACSRRSSLTLDQDWSVVIPDAGAPPAVASSARPALDAAITKPGDDAGANDFEDQFEYGMYDAGVGDAGTLAKKLGYDSYTNDRFGFSLDVPRGMTPMPAPDNSDGMQWRVGHLFAMTASGMNYMPDLGMPLCPDSKNVTAHNKSKSGCFSTGRRDRTIFWERHVIAREIDFSLRFQYAESLKDQLDAIVTHVNASWKH